MMEAWVVQLDQRAASRLGALRLLPGLAVCEQGDRLWLRGEGGDETLAGRLLALPGSCLHAVLSDGQLVPHGARVPRGRLPEGPWTPLVNWLSPTLEPAALSGELPGRVSVTVVPSTMPREANVLLTTLESWATFASEAAQVRLAELRFAVANLTRSPLQGRGRGEELIALVWGEPLPPLPGTFYCEQAGVGVQAGYAWEPAVEASVLRDLLGLAKGDLALLHASCEWDHINAGHFARATRSAIRATAGRTGDA